MKISENKQFNGGNNNHNNRRRSYVRYIGHECSELVNGECYTFKELAKVAGVAPETMKHRVRQLMFDYPKGTHKIANDDTLRTKAEVSCQKRSGLTSGLTKEELAKRMELPRCETKPEVLMAKWLRRKL